MQKQYLAPMRIGVIAPPIEDVPPKMYGGTERIVSTLTEELVRRGHDVTLFASGKSKTSAKLVSVFPKALREAYPLPEDLTQRIKISLVHLGNAYAMQDQFDIIHDHTGFFGLPFAQNARIPVVSTMHGSMTPDIVSAAQQFSKPYLVSISHSQQHLASHLNFIANVYNGLRMASYPFSRVDKGYLLAVGRFSPEKGIHNAITIARKSGLPLLIAAKLEEHNREYFETKIKPFLTGSIQWIGEVTEKQRNELMSHALAFLHPLEWEEPFGLTIIEAMSCGAPIIAFDKGSMKEIIRHGKTGFIAKNISDATQQIMSIASIDRAYCRSYSLTHFSGDIMATEYEAVYKTILQEEFLRKYGLIRARPSILKD